MKNDYTTWGGGHQTFPPTHWPDVLQGAVHEIIALYWKPVYCYIRKQQKDIDNEKAKDLTQDFFQVVVLERDFLQNADPTRGRFRNYLLKALQRFLIDKHRWENAGKRLPREGLTYFADMESIRPKIDAADLSPDEIYHRAWASMLLEETITSVKQECYRTDKKIHWQVFHARVLTPVYTHADPEPWENLCQKYNIEPISRARNMIVTVSRTFQRMLRRRIRKYVRTESEVQEELHQMMKILAKYRAKKGNFLRNLH